MLRYFDVKSRNAFALKSNKLFVLKGLFGCLFLVVNELNMSNIGLKANISVNASNSKIIPENFRIRDLTSVIPLGTSARRASHESHSLLGLWMEQSPFSHRELLMVQTRAVIPKKPLQSSCLYELSVLRNKNKLTSDAYAAFVEVVFNVAAVNKVIESNKPLSELTVREKNTHLERLGLYDEHFKWVLSGFANAKFHQEANEVVSRVKHDIHQVLETIRNECKHIRADICPSVQDLRDRRLYV